MMIAALAVQNPAYSPAPAPMLNPCPHAWAIIVAAGSGSRMGASTGGVAKQFLAYRGAPLYWHSLCTLARCAFVDGCVLVLPRASLQSEQARLDSLRALCDPGVPVLLAAGGLERQDSVFNGLTSVPPECKAVIVHDAARPFLTPGLVWNLYEEFKKTGCSVVPGIEIADTVKMVSADVVTQTLQRSCLRSIQTPQIFPREELARAHMLARASGLKGTDDASLVEAAGGIVRTAPGEIGNMKITRQEDLRLLEQPREPGLPCCGFGYDVHRFGPGRPLILGGVRMPGQYELMAHSDGDVLLHALCDAILGCAALGDLGMHFPDTDPAYAGISSSVLVDRVLAMARDRGVEICHADLTIVAQKPRLAPYAEEIRANVAMLLQLDRTHVNFKSTTEERLGFTGRVEGIKAYALVSAISRQA